MELKDVVPWALAGLSLMFNIYQWIVSERWKQPSLRLLYYSDWSSDDTAWFVENMGERTAYSVRIILEQKGESYWLSATSVEPGRLAYLRPMNSISPEGFPHILRADDIAEVSFTTYRGKTIKKRVVFPGPMGSMLSDLHLSKIDGKYPEWVKESF